MADAPGWQSAADERRAERASRRADRGSRGPLADLADKPAAIMVPVVVLVAVSLLLAAFGAVMIYSASSATALYSSDTGFDAAYYGTRQLLFVGVGVVFALIVLALPEGLLESRVRWALWGLCVLLLLLVCASSLRSASGGATRWLSVGGMTVQPSEFSKFAVVLVAAASMARYFGGRPATSAVAEGLSGWLDAHGLPFGASFVQLVLELLVGVGLPVCLYLLQPDKGTTVIVCVTVFVMLYLGGMSKGATAGLLALGAAAILFLIFKDPYSLARLQVMGDPLSEENYLNGGWQLAQSLYAFGSGGLFGVGLGMGRQKYSYLSQAYTDFIMSVVGEELGLVGVLAVLAAFAALGWAGFRIARYAPDLASRLVAAGSTTMLLVQLLVNVGGVLCMIPLSGKPVPFVSYGGSSVVSSFLLVGLVVRVGRFARLPETVYEARRRDLRVSDDGRDERDDPGLSSAGVPTRRSQRAAVEAAEAMGRRQRSAPRPGATSRAASPPDGAPSWGSPRPLTLVQGGLAGQGRAGTREGARGGYERVDLGPSAAERLRPRSEHAHVRERSHRHDE